MINRICETCSVMIIEQSMTKSIKTEGDIARGRSKQKSDVVNLEYGTNAVNTVNEGIEKL